MISNPLTGRATVMTAISFPFSLLCLTRYALNPQQADALFVGLAGAFICISVVLSGWKGLPNRILVLASLTAFVAAFMFALGSVFLYRHSHHGPWWMLTLSAVLTAGVALEYLRIYHGTTSKA